MAILAALGFAILIIIFDCNNFDRLHIDHGVVFFSYRHRNRKLPAIFLRSKFTAWIPARAASMFTPCLCILISINFSCSRSCIALLIKKIQISNSPDSDCNLLLPERTNHRCSTCFENPYVCVPQYHQTYTSYRTCPAE